MKAPSPSEEPTERWKINISSTVKMTAATMPRVIAPPTWRSAITRGIVAAVIFTVLLMLIFQRSVGSSLGLGAFMLVFYIPTGYYIDTMMWRRRERARIRERQQG